MKTFLLIVFLHVLFFGVLLLGLGIESIVEGAHDHFVAVAWEERNFNVMRL